MKPLIRTCLENDNFQWDGISFTKKKKKKKKKG